MGIGGGAVVMTVDFNGEILIPHGDIGDFAVVACDQFTAEPEYWNDLAAQMPPLSALDVILPECFLSQEDARLQSVRRACASMLENGRFDAVRGAVYVTRRTAYGRTRHGVVASVDLNDYDYKQGAKTLIRASERTIESRIPPRVAIRNAIDIELPHILLLVDDKDDMLMRACKAAKKRIVYDGELKGNGGRLTGELIEDTVELDKAVQSIIRASEKKFGEKLFALVGDGNHSLATAKYCNVSGATPLNGRALVEIVNIYDDGLVFEPIHRLVQTADPKGFINEFANEISGDATTLLYAPEPVELAVPSDKVKAITDIDAFCEAYVARNGGYVDYVHGDEALKRSGHVGISLCGIRKDELFDHVIKNGVLPKKTFSLGEAEEKRYYAEARRIK